jgi:pyruvate/2-oxoglutarate/acetoin dehydrogenase E1 component
MRVATRDTPIPYSRPMEQFALSSVERITEAAERLVSA